MNEFKFDGLDAPLVLPEKYLTAEQWEDCLRFFTNEKIEEVNLTDLATLRKITVMLMKTDADLGSLPMTPHNLKTFMAMYNCVGDLISSAMGVGDEVVNEEIKKDVAPPKTRKRKQKVGVAK